jgi:hypothetical protein
VTVVRVFGALLVVVLLALAASLFLRSESTQSSFEAVTSIATDLREGGVVGQSFDPRDARRMVDLLTRLIVSPDQIADRTDDLRSIAETAASWADAAPSPSTELTVAVSLRAAAGELRTYALRPAAAHLEAAERSLDRARSALAGPSPPNDPTGAVRERLENLQRSQQERQLEFDEELER